MQRHKLALRVIAVAICCLLILGWFHARAMGWPLWHGEFCSLANGVTDGCDYGPRGHYAYLVYALEYIIVVPLLGATFSLFTSGVTASHVRKAADAIKDHVEARLQHHLRSDRQNDAAGFPPERNDHDPAD